MKNRFNINEEEKNRIKALHGIKVINEQGLIWTPESEELHKQGQRVGETMADYENRARKEGFNPCDGRAPQFNKWMEEQGRDCEEIRQMIKDGTWKGSETTTTDTTDTSGVQIKWKSCEGNSTSSSWICVDPQYGNVGAQFLITIDGSHQLVYVYEVGDSCDSNSVTITASVNQDVPCPNNSYEKN